MKTRIGIIIAVIFVVLFMGVVGFADQEAANTDLVNELIDDGFVQDAENENVYRYYDIWLYYNDFEYIYAEVNVKTGDGAIIFISTLGEQFETNDGDHIFGMAQYKFNISDVDDYEILNKLYL